MVPRQMVPLSARLFPGSARPVRERRNFTNYQNGMTMKHSSAVVLFLALVGAVVLVASSFYFGSPLFGWLITIAIIAIYIGSEIRTYRGIRKIEAERKILDACQESIPHDPEGNGLVAERIRLVKKLSDRGIPLNPQTLKDVFDSREETNVGRSSGGVVILLGLMGTFFGLMLAVSTAGKGIEINTAPEATLPIIQAIFSSMKGIFGTSLCGVFAALILNACHGIHLYEHSHFITDLDEFTLFDIIPEFTRAKNDASSEIHQLVEVVADATAKSSKALAENPKAAQAEVLEGVLQANAERMQSTGTAAADALKTSMADVSREVSAGVQNQIKSADAEWKAFMEKLSASSEALEKHQRENLEALRSIATDVAQQASQGTAELSKSVSGEIAQLSAGVARQVENSGEQCKQFMDKLAETSAESEKHQKEGLETLRDVAVDVATKAEAGSAGLSKSVAEEIGKLSEEVQASFRELASSSSALVASQKELIAGIESRVVKENESSGALAANMTQAAELMRVNQSEFAANLEMFRKGIEAVLEKVSGDSSEKDNEQNFIEQLHLSLEAFHDRASEVLMENAVKTQEILLDVLEQTQRAGAAKPAEPKAGA